MCAGCTTWTPEQHVQREGQYIAQKRNVENFEIVGANVTFMITGATRITMAQPVASLAPIETTAQTAIKEAAGVGKALIAQTPVVAAAVIANAAFKNPTTTDTRIENTTTTTTTMGAE
ncbi:hypothetical protein EOL73_00120 [Candidatus Saccharibacteria bacterium]|nr:hypothetical protein [Candidatus Saccharibacteria bacterium]